MYVRISILSIEKTSRVLNIDIQLDGIFLPCIVDKVPSVTRNITFLGKPMIYQSCSSTTSPRKRHRFPSPRPRGDVPSTLFWNPKENEPARDYISRRIYILNRVALGARAQTLLSFLRAEENARAFAFLASHQIYVIT